MQIKPIMLGAVLLLAGCMNQSQIQSKYAKSKNLCRIETGRLMAGSDAPVDPTSAQAAANNNFLDCMTKAGWRAPKPQQVAQTTNPPTGSPSTNPSAAVTRQRPPQNPQGGAQVQPAPAPQAPQKVAQTQNPPSGAPSVNPSAAAAKQAPVQAAAPQPAAAAAQPSNALRNRTSSQEFTLPGQQPARPPTVPAPAYGSAARKF